MSLHLTAIVLTGGQTVTTTLPNTQSIQAVKLTNGTPFDITFSGFGVLGNSVVPAGTEYMLYADVYDSGQLIITGVNNVGSTSTGVVNLVVFFQDEKLPPGTWPITVPAQGVSTTVTTANQLINTGNPVGTVFIQGQVIADLNSSVSVQNDGTMTLGDAAHNGSFTKFGSVSNFTIDGTGLVTIGWKLLCNLINTITGNDLALNAETGHKLAFQINAADVCRVLSTGLVCDKLASLTGSVTLNANTGSKISLTVNAAELAYLDATGMNCNIFQARTGISANTMINTETGQSITLRINSSEIANISSTGFNVTAGNIIVNGGKIGQTAAGDIIDASSGTDVFYKTRGTTADIMEWQVPNGTTVMKLFGVNNAGSIGVASTLSIGGDLKLGTGGTGLNNNIFYADGSKQSGIHQFTASSGVATNHGCNKTPQGISAIPSSGGATTQGISALTSTQITIVTGTAVASNVICSTFN